MLTLVKLEEPSIAQVKSSLVQLPQVKSNYDKLS